MYAVLILQERTEGEAMNVRQHKGAAYRLGIMSLLTGAAFLIAAVISAARGSAFSAVLLMVGGALSGAGLAALAARLIGKHRSRPEGNDRPR